MIRGISNKKRLGFTLIEMVVLIGIFGVVIISFYQLFSLGTSQMLEAKYKLGAVALANEKMETVRNMEYDDIGITTGVPSGSLLDEEAASRSGRIFYVFTAVQFTDDPYDGTAAGGTDGAPNDYKTVRIKVAWENDINSAKSVTQVSTFAPQGREASIPGTGVLSVNVLDNQGNGIANATLKITNAFTGYSQTINTNSDGNQTLVGLPARDQEYKIEVTKGGYYGVMTLPPVDASSTFTPVDIHASVIDGDLNTKAIITDRLSALTLRFKDPFGVSLPNIDFNLKGGRKIGDTIAAEPEPVYEYDNNLNSGGDGNKDIENLSFGPYFVKLDAAILDRQFIKVDPGEESVDKIDLPPDTSAGVDVIVADKNFNSLLVKVKNNADNSFIEGASVNLKNVLLGYDKTITTDKYGQAYFPDQLPEMVQAQYDVTVSAPGFTDKTDTVEVNKFVAKEYLLAP